MPYTATIDEYQGDAFNYRGAGYRDAPGVLGYTMFHLAQGSALAAYGALTSANDLDVYRLGWLLPGVYTFQVKPLAWHSASSIAASATPSMQILDAQGLAMAQASSSNGTLAFTVSQAGDYQVQLGSASGVATQYQLSYSFAAATPNVAANVVAQIGGTLTEGQTLTAIYSFTDANGSAQVSPDIQWYAYNASTQRWQPMAGANQTSYLLTAQDVGKRLAYTVSFVDNLGYLESKASSATSAAIAAASVPVDTTPPLAPRWSSQSAWHYTVNPHVTLTTSLGVIELELFPNAAPATVDNWLAYVNSGFLDGLIFHRVIQQFMIQGGGFDPNWVQQTDTYAPVVLESRNGLSNLRGTLAMARTSDPNSATSQFFINQVDNLFLNFDPSVPTSQGYAVFGQVIKGMEVVDQIAAETTATIAGMSNVPTIETLIHTAVQSQAGVAYSATGSIAIDALETTGSWAYSLDAGQTWRPGVEHVLTLSSGYYKADSIRIRQWDAAGNQSVSDAHVDNALVVGATGLISGHVYEWKTHALLSDVQLNFSAADAPAWLTVSTDHDGRFTAPLLEGTSATLQAHKALTSGDMGAAVITMADALAALKLAAGRNPNADGAPVSPYQFMAADVNGDGRVTSADALAIFKMVQGGSVSTASQWLFVDEAQDFWNEAFHSFSLSRNALDWQPNLLANIGTHNLVAVLQGDVDGSWSASAGTRNLDVIDPGYFSDLAAKLGVPLAQWGIWAA